MNILVLTEYYKVQANDYLVVNYITTLEKLGYKVKVVCCSTSEKAENVILLNLLFGVDYIKLKSNKWFNYLYKFVLVIVKKNLTGILFRETVNEVHAKLDDIGFKPNLILQFTSGSYEYVLFDMSKKFAQSYKVPYYLHSFDPIPNTINWGENNLLRKATIKLLESAIRSADRVSAVSPRMVLYFLETYKLSLGQMYTLYMPVVEKDNFSKPEKTTSFLYLGSIYGKRDPNPLFEAFNELMAQNPAIELILAGTGLKKNDLTLKYPNFKEGLKFIEWTNNPDDLIRESSFLIDLNADIAGDVFISSKLIRYLGFAKLILAIGNPDSAAADFAKNFKGVYFVPNLKGQILNQISEMIESVSFRIDRTEEIRSLEINKLILDYMNDVIDLEIKH